jgi:hypothetical protein
MKKALLVLMPFLSAAMAFAEPAGSIKGRAMDRDTQSPLAGANVFITNTALGAVTDGEGGFAIPNVPVGGYSIRVSYIGYRPIVKTDVIVKSNRISVVDAELVPEAVEMQAVTVRAGYFEESREKGSELSLAGEEIRRAPGSAGDVSRILYGLPSVAKVNDQMNQLIVRGGSPIENAFYIDGIEIPNINHFPTQGSSGGPIGLLNVDFVRDVRFSSGGFGAAYGGRLSSVMDIAFREGSREGFEGQLDLNWAGYGGAAEGPLFGKRGSWFLSVRRSYLDQLAKVVDVGSIKPPTYGDVQGKAVYDINPSHQLSLLAVWGYDLNNPDKEAALNGDMTAYGSQDLAERTTGIGWRALWGKNAFSNTTISLTSDRFRESFTETSTDLPLFRNRSLEQTLRFRNVNTVRFGSNLGLDFGMEAKLRTADFNNRYEVSTNSLGNPVDPLVMKRSVRDNRLGAFFNWTVRPTPLLSGVIGLRADYASKTGRTILSPRISIGYQLTDRTEITGSAGVYFQELPLILLAQIGNDVKLDDPRAVHAVVGLNHLIGESTRLTVEAYQKTYRDFPMDPGQPGLFMIDELIYRYGFFSGHQNLISNGKAEAKGVELTLQKKLADKVYGLASAAFFKTRYQGLDGIWRDRVYDNRFLFSAEGGYKLNRSWEFSLRWIWAGGAPYTPIDPSASALAHRDVLDGSQINARRYPAYHALNIRIDRRFNWNRRSLVAYLSVWNVYGRKNVANYFWDDAEGKIETIYQWGTLPIFGLEFEF